jgi:hypothetical protein
VLVSYGRWPGADLTLTAGRGSWDGLAAGRGRLRCRELTINAHGRGAASRPRRVKVHLPDPAGRVASAPQAPEADRPVLTLVAGGQSAEAPCASQDPQRVEDDHLAGA